MSYFSSLMKLNELKINGEIVDEDDDFNVEEDQATADPADVANDVAEDENTEQNQQEQDDAQQPNNEDDLEDTEEDDFTIDETDDEEDNFTLDDEVEDDTDNPPPTDIGEAENAPANQPANDNAGGGGGNDPAPANDTATAANQEVTGNDVGGGEADDGLGDNAADDFNIDAGGGGEAEGGNAPAGDAGGAADTGDGGGQPQKQEDPLPENPSDNVKDEEKRAAEESIYDSLTDDQKRIRVLQLKIDYKDLYETIVTTMEGINDIPKTVENLDTIKRLNIFLGKAKQILIDYIENNFDTTTYIENYTMYLKYLAVFRTVAKVIEELNNYSEKIDSKKGD